MHNKVDNLFPPGTKVRTIINFLEGGLYVLKNEGVASFINRAWLRFRGRSSRPKIVLQKEIRSLQFPAFEHPEVSIVIPVFNKALYTFNCLMSVLRNTEGIEYEVIVVDNASTDETSEMLSKIENIRVIKNSENLGFVDACNRGAKDAKGRFLHFLNNDTVVLNGWLSSLIKTLEKYSRAGAVGSKLIYPNYKIQEAGGIVWKDASAWNYGKFDDPDKPEYNYVREVDYCSAASLMIRKNLFEQIGGFDRRFSPAYWEDTDLCFSIRSLGYRVLLQPSSVVIHFEGVSAGRNTASGMKRHQDLNKPKFIEKWSDELENQYGYQPENVFLARDRNRNRRILVIDHHVPEYDRDAGSFFMFSMLRDLTSMGCRVVFWPHNLFAEDPYTGILQQMGIEVIYNSVNFKKYMKSYGKFFHMVFLTRTHIAIHYIDIVKKYVPNIIYHAPDLEFIREKRRAEFEKISAKKLKKIKEREFYLLNNSHLITTVSSIEGDIIQKEIPNTMVVVVPHPIEKSMKTQTVFEGRRDLLFVGSMHTPNTDAILYFAKEVMPDLITKLPDIKFYVVGSNPPKEILALNSDNIVVTGFVKDLLPYFEKCRIYIAPLRYGAGVKGKIIEAMNYGMPVITTSIGAEGLNLTHGENILIADNRTTLIEYIESLYNDRELWNKLRQNAFKHVEDNFSQDVFNTQIKKIMDYIGQ